MAGPTVSLIVRLVDQLSGVAGRVVNSTKRIGAGFQGVGRDADAAGTRIDRLLGRLANATLAIHGLQRVAQGLSNSVSSAVTKTADFDDTLQGVAQTGGLTQERLAAIRAELLRLAPVLGRKPDALANLLGDLVQAGLSDDVATRLLEPIGRVAVATRSEISDIGKTAIALTKNLKVPVEEIIAIFDALATAGKLGRFELKDMAQYFAQVAAAAANAGMEGKTAATELAAALQITRDAAGTPSAAANNLVNLLLKLRSPETVKKFQKHGVDIKEAIAEGLKQGRSPLETIILETKKLLEKDAKLAIGDLFSDQQVQLALGPLVRQFEEFQRIRAESAKAAGVIVADFQAMASTTKAAIDQQQSSAESLARTWGGILAPAARVAARWAAFLTEKLRAITEAFPAVGFAVGAAAMVASAIASVSTGLVGLLATAALLKGTAAGAAIGGVLAAIGGAVLWFIRLPFALLRGAVGIVVGAVQGIVAGIAGSGLGAALKAAVARFGVLRAAAMVGASLVKALAAEVAGGLAGVAAKLATWWSGLMLRLAGVRLGGALIAGLLSTRMGALLAGIFAPILAGLGAISAPMWAAVAAIVAAVAALAFGIYKYWQPIRAFLSGFFGYFAEEIAAGAVRVASAIGSLRGAIFAAVGGLVSGVVTELTGLWSKAAGAVSGSPVLGPIADAIGAVVARIASAVRSAADVIEGAVSGILGWLQRLFTPVELAEDARASWEAYGRSVAQSLVDAFKSIDLTRIGSEIIDSLLAGLQSAAERVVSWVTGFVDRLKGLFSFTARPTIAPSGMPQPGDPGYVPMNAPGGQRRPGPQQASLDLIAPNARAGSPRTESDPAITRLAAAIESLAQRPGGVNATVHVASTDPEQSARETVRELNRLRQAGMYDGALA